MCDCDFPDDEKSSEEECLCDLPNIIINDLDRSQTVITIQKPTTTMANNCESACGSPNMKLTGTLSHLQNNNPILNYGKGGAGPLTATRMCGSRVHGFMSELKQVGSDLAQKINLLTDIDEELATALSRLDTQEAEITRYRQQVFKLEADLKARNCKVKDLERKLTEHCQTSDIVKQLQCELDTANSRVKQMEECLEEQKQHKCELNQKIDSLKSKLKNSEKSVAYYRSLNTSLEKTVESKKLMIDDLQHQTAQYLERLVECEKVRMSSKYLDQCNTEEQLQVARMMLKEKDFEIAQLWENVEVLESALCENLQKLGVERRNFSKDALVAAVRRHQQNKPCHQGTPQQGCNCKQCVSTEGTTNVNGFGCEGGGEGGSNKRYGKLGSKIEAVEKNLLKIHEKLVLLKKQHANNGSCGGAVGAITASGGGGSHDPCCCGGSVSDFNGCNCGK